MKISISVTDEDVALLDQVADAGEFSSRSAVVQYALSKLRVQGLQGEYADAWQEFTEGGDAGRWERSAP